MRWPWRLARRRAAVPTMFGPARVYEAAGPDGDAIRVLEVGGAFQSAAYVDGRPDAPFAYLRAFDLAFEAGVPVRRALMLGGGAFAAPRHLLARHPDLALDVVEADPAIVAIARERFFLADAERACAGRLRVIVSDALSYLRGNAAGLGAAGTVGATGSAGQEASPGRSDARPEAPGAGASASPPAPAGGGGAGLPPASAPADPSGVPSASGPSAPVAYDLIMNDVFRGIDPDEGLLAPGALGLVRASLAPGGLYLANVVVPDAPEGVAALVEAGRVLERSFARVFVIPCADEGFAAEDNYLLVATDGPADVPGALPLPPA